MEHVISMIKKWSRTLFLRNVQSLKRSRCVRMTGCLDMKVNLADWPCSYSCCLKGRCCECIEATDYTTNSSMLLPTRRKENLRQINQEIHSTPQMTALSYCFSDYSLQKQFFSSSRNQGYVSPKCLAIEARSLISTLPSPFKSASGFHLGLVTG